MPTIGTAMAIVVDVDSPSASTGEDGGGGVTVEGTSKVLLAAVVEESRDACVGKIIGMSVTDVALVTVSGGVVVESTTTTVVVVLVVVVDTHEITSDPVAVVVDKTVPNRMMITSLSATSISAFSPVAHPPKSLQVALATEGTEVVGQTARYTPSMVSPVTLQPSIVARPVHVALHSYQTSF